MILVVSNQSVLFDCFKRITVEESLEELRTWEQIQFDTETFGRNPHICNVLCLQFGNATKDIQIVVDALTVNPLLYKEILETKLLIGHNLKFDIQFMFKYGIIIRKVWDTMIIEQLLHLGFDVAYFKYNLKDTLARYFNINLDKTIREEIASRGFDSNVITYAAGDVMYLENLKDLQYKKCQEYNCLIAASIENNFVTCIAYLEWCGIRLDENRWKLKIENNQKQLDKALTELNNWVVEQHLKGRFESKEPPRWFLVEENHRGDIIKHDYPKNEYEVKDTRIENDWGTTFKYVLLAPKSLNFVEKNLQGDLFDGFDLSFKCSVDWNSAKQVLPLVQALGFNTLTTDTKTGKSKHSVSEKVLKTQKGIADDFLELYLNYKGESKNFTTYGYNYLDAINPITGRIHTTFKQLGATSGRMACGNSKDSDTDLAALKKINANRCKFVQLQNLPADPITRSAFVPNPGNLMTSCDYSALESRLGADIYNEPEMLKEFLEGSGDMHSLCAKLVFKEELKDIAVKDIERLRPDLRKKVKPIEFSQQFGGGAKAVANSLGCSKQEAQQFVKAYADGFKGISKFKQIGSKFVRENGYIIICKHTGHRLFWEDWKKWREIENLPQYLYDLELSEKEKLEHDGAAANWDRLALNSPTQGTGIIILKYAMIIFCNWIWDNNYFNKILLCNLVHDESVIEYPEELKDIVVPKLVTAMEKAAAKLCKKLPIPAKPETGLHWIH